MDLQRARKLFGLLFIILFAVGMVALIVWLVSTTIAGKYGSWAPDPSTGRVFPHDLQRPRIGTWYVVYVTHGVDLTARISGALAAVGLGSVGTTLLALLYGNMLRLLLPSSFEFANLELKRYRHQVGSAEITEEGLRYVAAWRDLSRRWLLPFCVLIAGIGLPFIFIRRGVFWPLAVMGIAVVLSLLLGSRRRRFECPRCQERFYGKWRSEFLPSFCTNCGLPEKSPPGTDVSPDFVEWKKML